VNEQAGDLAGGCYPTLGIPETRRQWRDEFHKLIDAFFPELGIPLGRHEGMLNSSKTEVE